MTFTYNFEAMERAMSLLCLHGELYELPRTPGQALEPVWVGECSICALPALLWGQIDGFGTHILSHRAHTLGTTGFYSCSGFSMEIWRKNI
jgi:hypothetical protein